MWKAVYAAENCCCIILVKSMKQENCGNCDNCLNPKEKLEVKDSVKIVLDTINELDERFSIDYVVNIILGKTNPQIQDLPPR